MPRRSLGRTGFMATSIGSGDLADRSISIEQCVATLRRAIDAGVNVIDTAPNYEAGYSEEIVGRAVRDDRDALFIVSKIDDLESTVAPQIEASLERLQLSFTDAFVFHALPSMDLFAKLRQPGGGFDQLADAIRSGKTRFRGISSHNPDVLRAALEADLCDIVMFPVGPYVDWRFVDEILPLARSRNAGTICFKTFGGGKMLGDTTGYNQPLKSRPRGKVSSGGTDSDEATLPRLTVDECIQYTLTMDPDVALLGMSFPNEQDAAFAAVGNFSEPLSGEEMAAIRLRAKLARQDKGPCWWNPDPEA